jgi:ribonuclease BN (tRNA processing enzyme)
MSDGNLTVLGSCGGWPEPGRACAGFLLEHDGARIVLDLGYGTASRLLGILGSAAADGLDAVVVSHNHPDHMADLHALMRARWFGRRAAPAIPLFAPAAVLARLIELEDGDDSAVRHVFDWRPIPAPPQRAGPFRLDSVTVPHYVPSAGVRLSAPGLVIAYTGDTGPDPALAELGRDCDLYVVDATTRNQQSAAPRAPGVELNLTDREAGRIAAAAGARRLLLTHFWPGNDRPASRQAAASEFSGEILVASEGAVIPLP